MTDEAKGVRTPAETPMDWAGQTTQTEDPSLETLRQVPVNFPVVALGASAGGVEALTELMRQLQHDGMALVVVQHFPSGQESAMPDILARATALSVKVVSDGMALEHGTVFVTPPGMMPSLEGARFRLRPGDEAAGARMTIDYFMRALAAECGPASVGVVLSGTGTDGTLGLKEIKAAGGIALAQDPSSARYPDMPESAIAADCVDLVLPPREIADELMRLAGQAHWNPQHVLQQTDQALFARVIQRLQEAFRTDFGQYKSSTVERRILRRMALARKEKLADYIWMLERSSAELAALYRDLLINVTSFFRDREPFESLQREVLPRLLSDKRERSVRMWVPGCSTGEEAYTLAMCTLEVLGDKVSDVRVQIFATDLDQEATANARSGIFAQNIELDLTAERLQRFFVKRDRHYQISKRVRDMVVFAPHNIARDPPFSNMDLISCRNVLIYMQPVLQKKVLRIFHYALNPGGTLLLGGSETVGESSGLFTLLDRKVKLYSKRNIPTSVAFDLQTEITTAPASALAPTSAALEHTHVRSSRVSVQQLADRKVLERYGPPGVLVNENLEVVQFRGRLKPFLDPMPGSATLNLLKLARPELVLLLREAIARVFRDGGPLSTEAVQLKDETESRQISLDLLPVQDASSQSTCVLVLFKSTQHAPSIAPLQGAAAPDARAQELQRELSGTKEYLQSLIAELETTNEELQASNEELQSSNEELQSTNEELQTSKEELQSTNEELATVNEELQNRMLELGQSKDDVHHIIDGLDAAVLIVNMDLRVRMMTPGAVHLLKLSGADAGRPVGYLLPNSQGNALTHLASRVINDLQPQERSFTTPSGLPCRLRVTPYRNSNDTIKGAMICLFPEQKSTGLPAAPLLTGDENG